MVHTTHGDFTPSPAERIARALLDGARQDPALLGRTHAPRQDPAARHLLDLQLSSNALQPIRLLADAPFAVNQQLEELVSIAVASAQQAEDACQEVLAARHSARRGMALFAGFGVLGILLGLAAVADRHISGDTGPAPPSATVAQQEPLPPADAPAAPAAVQTADAAATPDPPAPSGATGGGLVIPTASAQPVMREVVPPVYHGPVSGYVAPWPSERRVGYSTNAYGRRVVVPRFFVTVQRDLGALFRGLAPHS